MKDYIGRLCFYCSLGGICLIFGCSGNGYITSGVNTVVGLDVSENPKTQVPHVRFGYVRSQLYYVPSGKTETTGGEMASSTGRADETPNVVSEIFVNSKFLSDITISEKFAIGSEAVHSESAQKTFSIPAAQAVASNGAVDVAAVTAAVNTSLNRPVRQPTAVSSEIFQREQSAARHKPSPSPGLPSPLQFAATLRTLDNNIPADIKTEVYGSVFDQAAISPTPDQFPDVNPAAVGPNITTLSLAYREFPDKQRQLSNLINQLVKQFPKKQAEPEKTASPTPTPGQ